MLAMRKRQRFNNSKSKDKIPKKRQQFNKRDNEEKKSLEKNKDKVENDRYIPFTPLTLFFPS